MFQITLPFLYLIAAAGFAGSRLRHDAGYAGLMRGGAFVLAAIAIAVHGSLLFDSIARGGGIHVSLLSSVSLIGLQLAIIGTLAAIDSDLRGVAAGLIENIPGVITAAVDHPDCSPALGQSGFEQHFF